MLGKKSSLAPVLSFLTENGVGLLTLFRTVHVCNRSIVFFTVTAEKFLYAHWLIFIVNKRADS